MHLAELDQQQFAVSCLRHVPPTRRADERDLSFWHETQLTLVIAHELRQAGRLEQVWPEWPSPSLAGQLRVAAAVAAGERRVLEEVLTAFATEGISPLLLKGAALAHTVYPAPWLRSRTDTDLLVPAGTLPHVAAVLAKVGFEPVTEVTNALISRQRHFLRRSGMPAALDIHESLVNPLVLRDLPQHAELTARAQSIPSLHLNAFALSTPDALLHALVHRVAHHNSTVDLLWLNDMRLLMSRMTTPDWELLATAAHGSRVCQIVLDGLHVLREVMDVAAPASIERDLAAVRGEPSAALLGGSLTELRLQWVNFRSLPGVRTKTAFIRAHLMPPDAELQKDATQWPVSVRYAIRAVRGLRKWSAPISRVR